MELYCVKYYLMTVGEYRNHCTCLRDQCLLYFALVNAAKKVKYDRLLMSRNSQLWGHHLNCTRFALHYQLRFNDLMLNRGIEAYHLGH